MAEPTPAAPPPTTTFTSAAPAPEATASSTTTTTQTHAYDFNIAMSCSGCSGAIERVLKRLEGVQSFDVSLEKQTAHVIAGEGLEYRTVLEKIRKTGKRVERGSVDGVEAAV